MSDTYRVLVTGSRDWDDYQAVKDALNGEYFRDGRSPYGPMIVVHGACGRGADAMADAATRQMMAEGRWAAPEPHPADWDAEPKRAGFIRNAEMVALGADVCLAFVAPCAKAGCRNGNPHGSHGATHCAVLAEKAGIPVRRYAPGGVLVNGGGISD